jgi:hypothetical protein
MVVVEQKPQTRRKQAVVASQTVVSKRRTPRWEQRRQELLQKERAMAGIFGMICLFGTLGMLYVAAHASTTNEGYRRTELRRQVKEADAESLRLQTEIRHLEDGSAIAQTAQQRKLIRSPQSIHYFGKAD